MARLGDLPNDLHELVGERLCPRDYLLLRGSSKLFQHLDPIPKVKLNEYVQIVGRKPWAFRDRLKLSLSKASICDRTLDTLNQLEHLPEMIRVMKSPFLRTLISEEWKQRYVQNTNRFFNHDLAYEFLCLLMDDGARPPLSRIPDVIMWFKVPDINLIELVKCILKPDDKGSHAMAEVYGSESPQFSADMFETIGKSQNLELFEFMYLNPEYVSLTAYRKGMHGKSAIHYIAEHGTSEMMQIILASTEESSSPLFRTKSVPYDIAKLSNSNGKLGKEGMLLYLLRSEMGVTPLELSVGNPSMFQLLYNDHRTHESLVLPEPILHLLVSSKSANMISLRKLLKDLRVEPSIYISGVTALHLAAKSRSDFLKALMNNNRVDVCARDGRTFEALARSKGGETWNVVKNHKRLRSGSSKNEVRGKWVFVEDDKRVSEASENDSVG